MPRIEIIKDIGGQVRERIWEKTVLDIPDENGSYETGLGEIKLKNLERDKRKNPIKIALEGKALRGTLLKNRHKRNPRKIISLKGGWLGGGRGQQTLSKRESVTVSYPKEGECVLPLGVPVIIRNNRIPGEKVEIRTQILWEPHSGI